MLRRKKIVDFESFLPELESRVLPVQDFPEAGVLFQDLTPLLSSGPLFEKLIAALAQRYKGRVDAIFSPESRGFLFGAPLAARLGCSFVPVRKPGKLPRETFSVPYTMEYGSGDKFLHVHRDALPAIGLRALIVDDVLATGGTAKACVELAKRLDAQVVENVFIVEIAALCGRKLLSDPVFSVISR